MRQIKEHRAEIDEITDSTRQRQAVLNHQNQQEDDEIAKVEDEIAKLNIEKQEMEQDFDFDNQKQDMFKNQWEEIKEYNRDLE